MRKSKKISDASTRVLETLKVLYKESAGVQDIIYHFEKLDPNNRVYTNEVILKYINTLKVFGLRFVKEKDKYILLNTPNRFDFNESELKSICMIEKLSELLPEERVKIEINKFLHELERRFSDNTRLLSHNITKPDFINLEFDYSKYAQRIREYEKYCIDGQRLKIVYKNQSRSEVSAMVEPNEIKYRGNEVYLSVYNPISAQIQDINFNSILQIEQLPLKSNQSSMFSSSVTFQLKDRLANSYKFHEGEELVQKKSDGSIVVLNRKEDRVLLLKRLMRYGEACEVISPKNIRDDMKEMIKVTLSNYS